MKYSMHFVARCQLFIISLLTNGILLAIITSTGNKGTVAMIIRTRIFELGNGKYRNLSELAQAMGLSVSQVYRVREGKRSINQKFIIGAIRAFPNYRLDELFYFDSKSSLDSMARTTVTRRYRYVVQQYIRQDLSNV